jgi:hypothetical protein
MTRGLILFFVFATALLASARSLRSDEEPAKKLKPAFHTSDRCLACHNGLTTPSGRDVSIGFDWRSSVMANSARDPYWQASVRREDIDHPSSSAEIEDSCADCHMPMSRYQAKLEGHLGGVFAHLPFDADPQANAPAEDGVTCSVCHQIGTQNLGKRPSFNGGFVVDPPETRDLHPEYGPFQIQSGLARIMQTSTGGFRPTDAPQIEDSRLCATCHTLYTTTLSPEGKALGQFPEQMPYLEWLHSDYVKSQSCQSCHMPKVPEDAPITAVLGPLRSGVRLHTFVGANVFLLNVLNAYRGDLSVKAMPLELNAEAQRTADFLQSQAARVTIRSVEVDGNQLRANVFVENLTGHKLPTAFPSRRAWIHFVVRDGGGHTIFESGAMNPDGSIRGNPNDADAARFEPHHREITSSEQVQIYEPVLQDSSGHVTTGLAAGAGYIKDNRLLPAGFDKRTADKDIAVVGDAADDPAFNAGGHTIRYSIPLPNAQGALQIEAELWYQPIGFRWAHNLEPYDSFETHRFLSYYNAMPAQTAIVLARASATR